MPDTTSVEEFLARETARAVAPAVRELSARVAARHAPSACVVLHYGSCLRTGEVDHGIVDFYVLVDGYRDCYASKLSALANRVLPPNVFYLAETIDGVVLRTKYAIVSLAHFARLCSTRTLNASVWARFAQPAAITWARDCDSAARARAALAEALITFLTETEGLLPPERSAAQWWALGLAASYAAELRPEAGVEVGRRIFATEPARYRAALAAARAHTRSRAGETGSDGDTIYISACAERERKRCRRRWRVRRVQGKALNLLRLVKAVFTFDGAVEYALWKVERHSGVQVQASDFQKRWPLLGIWPLAWRLYRKGAFR